MVGTGKERATSGTRSDKDGDKTGQGQGQHRTITGMRLDKVRERTKTTLIQTHLTGMYL